MKTISLIVTAQYVSSHSGKDILTSAETHIEVATSLSTEDIGERLSDEKLALLEEEFGTIDQGGDELTLEFDLPDSIGSSQEEVTADMYGLLEALIPILSLED